jgi:hypothetical protein
VTLALLTQEFLLAGLLLRLGFAFMLLAQGLLVAILRIEQFAGD